MSARRSGGGAFDQDVESVPPDCLALRALKLSRVVSGFYAGYFGSLGMGAGQFCILVHVHRGKGSSLTGLAVQLRMDRTTLSRNMTPLQRKGWIRVEKAGDRRARRVWLTAAGRTVLAEAIRRWRRAQEEVNKRLGRHKIRRMLDSMDEVLAAVP